MQQSISFHKHLSPFYADHTEGFNSPSISRCVLYHAATLVERSSIYLEIAHIGYQGQVFKINDTKVMAFFYF